MAKVKNLRIKQKLTEHGLSQRKLAAILKTYSSYISMLLSYELAEEEQDKIVKAIDDYVKEASHESD